MGDVIFLVRSVVSEDTVAALNQLLIEAQAGRVVGLAWVEFYGGHRYLFDIAGEAQRVPEFTRGALKSLDDDLAKVCRPK